MDFLIALSAEVVLQITGVKWGLVTVNLWPGVNRPPVVQGVCLGPQEFCHAWGQVSEVARYLRCPLSLLSLRYLCFYSIPQFRY